MPFEEDGDSEKSESAVYDTPSTFNPYDPPIEPESVHPTSPGPVQSSDAPAAGDTSGEDGESQAQTSAASSEDGRDDKPLPEYDHRYREPFEGLLYLGRLEETFRKWGHTFVIRTLTTEELTKIGLAVKPYEETRTANAAYQAAVVAASVVTVDGQPLPTGITVDDADDLLAVRLPYVMKKWMPPVREMVYNRCFALELVARRALDAMGEASG